MILEPTIVILTYQDRTIKTEKYIVLYIYAIETNSRYVGLNCTFYFTICCILLIRDYERDHKYDNEDEKIRFRLINR